MVAAHIRRVGLETAHFKGNLTEQVYAVPEPHLEQLLAVSTSLAEVLRALGLPVDGRAHAAMKERVASLGFQTSHLRGQGWARDETKETHASVAQMAQRNSFSNDEVFVENSPVFNGPRVVRRLRALGWPYRCSWCGISEWRGEPLVLHLDHVNGINNDNRLENLRLLCPNCHSQTATYCNRAREIAACYTLRTRAWRNW